MRLGIGLALAGAVVVFVAFEWHALVWEIDRLRARRHRNRRKGQIL